jgi:hypothetical protein
MKTSKFNRKIYGDNAKLKKGLNHHGSRLHVGTWKMGGWGLNIAPEMLHVLVDDRFQGSCLEAHVSWCAISNGQNEHLTAIETRHVYVPVCSGPRYPCVETRVGAALKRMTHLQFVTEITSGYGPIFSYFGFWASSGFRVQNFENKNEKGIGPVLYGFSVLKVFWGVGVGHVFSCREVCSHEGGGTLEGVPKP